MTHPKLLYESKIELNRSALTSVSRVKVSFTSNEKAKIHITLDLND